MFQHDTRLSDRRILVTDIGATNSRFALLTGNPLTMTAACTVPSAADSFDAILENIAGQTPELFAHVADCCVLSVAGPVVSQEQVRITNQPYSIHRSQLKAFARDILFINDFEAQARACATPVMTKARLLLAGNAHEGETPENRLEDGLAVIGAGTGLGIACCRRTAGHLDIMPTEAGHLSASFQPGEEQAYADFLRACLRRDVLEYEDTLSGAGLSRLHAYLTGETLRPAQITSQPDFGTSRTCAWFARIYGRICRNMTIAMLPRGGIVLTGGVAGRCPALVTHPAFREEFLHMREPFTHLMEATPIWLNLDQRSGLWGAAQAAEDFLRRE